MKMKATKRALFLIGCTILFLLFSVSLIQCQTSSDTRHQVSMKDEKGNALVKSTKNEAVNTSNAHTNTEQKGNNANQTADADNAGSGNMDQEAVQSNNLLLIVMIIGVSIMLTYIFMKYDARYLPESIVTIFVGAFLGAALVSNGKTVDDVFRLDTEYFFLVLLPPIIFDSGYTLSKASFFSNIGTIITFAVLGTFISSLVIGFGLGMLGILPWIDALVLGSILSAIDPVATIAVFQTVEVDSTLSTLVFGESVLNDAISIVLYKTYYQFLKDGFSMVALLYSFTHFVTIFFGSSALGILIALLTALLFKYVDIRKFPSLEISLMFISCYIPYLVGEGLSMSGILCLLANAIVNSHYTHYNLSKETQITLRQISQALSFICETMVFAYLGLAVFTYTHKVDLVLLIATIFFCLLSRAVNIFPLSSICNKFRTQTISQNAQIVMWFSGLRGAIAFSLSLTLSGEYRNAMVTTTLIICLLSTIFLGGGTLPLFKHLYGDFMHRAMTSKLVSSNETSFFDSFDEVYLRSFFCIEPTDTRGIALEEYQQIPKDEENYLEDYKQ